MALSPGSASASGPAPKRSGPGVTPLTLFGEFVTLVAVALLSFVACVVVFSPIQHARSQQLAYADFRADLAQATAPTGQRSAEGQLLSLGTPVALLSIPAMGLQREVVFEGTTSGVLTKGPGHKRSTVSPGQPGVSIIYGRAWSYGGPFGGVSSLRIGDQITVTTGQGESTYQVRGVRNAGDVIPPAPDVAAGEGRLTLVSAIGRFYVPESVVYVDAELTSEAFEAPARAFGASSLLPAEESLSGDSSRWIDVFLYLQLAAAVSLATAWLSYRWARLQAWLVAFPVLALSVILASGAIIRVLPNLL